MSRIRTLKPTFKNVAKALNWTGTQEEMERVLGPVENIEVRKVVFTEKEKVILRKQTGRTS